MPDASETTPRRAAARHRQPDHLSRALSDGDAAPAGARPRGARRRQSALGRVPDRPPRRTSRRELPGATLEGRIDAPGQIGPHPAHHRGDERGARRGRCHAGPGRAAPPRPVRRGHDRAISARTSRSARQPKGSADALHDSPRHHLQLQDRRLGGALRAASPADQRRAPARPLGHARPSSRSRSRRSTRPTSSAIAPPISASPGRARAIASNRACGSRCAPPTRRMPC